VRPRIAQDEGQIGFHWVTPEGLRELHRVLDRLCHEYAMALERTGLGAEVRSGLIIGTAVLFSIRARQPLDLLGPTPSTGSWTTRRPARRSRSRRAARPTPR
jgi:hypothetical protein